jgi:cation transporter-like permease
MSSNKNTSPFPWQIHPIWRGIGFAFLVIIPAISYALVDMLLPMMGEPLPGILAEAVQLPIVGEIEALWGRVFISAVLSVVLFMLLALIGSIFYSMLGGRDQEKQATMLKKDRFKY